MKDLFELVQNGFEIRFVKLKHCHQLTIREKGNLMDQAKVYTKGQAKEILKNWNRIY